MFTRNSRWPFTTTVAIVNEPRAVHAVDEPNVAVLGLAWVEHGDRRAESGRPDRSETVDGKRSKTRARGIPREALFVAASAQHVLEVAQKLRDQVLMTLEGEWASANASLIAQAEKFEADMRAAAAELEQKHAFERG